MLKGLVAQSSLLCLALSTLAAPGLSANEPLPRYDLERFCTWAALSEVANRPSTNAGSVRQLCRERERTAEEELKNLWAEMPQGARSWCAGQVGNAIDQVAAPTGSYELLYEYILDQTLGFVPSWN